MTKKPMTKAELVSALAEAASLDKKKSNFVLDTLSEIIIQEVSEGGAVTLPNVGKIFYRERPARSVRNPRTGDKIEKPADRAIKFTVAKAIKDSINQ